MVLFAFVSLHLFNFKSFDLYLNVFETIENFRKQEFIKGLVVLFALT
jgi:NADPH-dependent 7-cyano-7-deazaguanine reductase QueF-like protein